jgi:hypothetical protein
MDIGYTLLKMFRVFEERWETRQMQTKRNTKIFLLFRDAEQRMEYKPFKTPLRYHLICIHLNSIC